MVNAFENDELIAEMESIFAELPVTKTGHGRREPWASAISRSPSRTGRWLTLAAPATVVLALAALALHAMVAGGPTASTEVRTSADHAPRHPAYAVHGTEPPVTSMAAASTPAAVGSSRAYPAPVALPSLTVAATAVTPPTSRISSPPRNLDAVPRSSATESRSAEPGPTGANPCPPHGETNDCIYADVRQADRRLRIAYREAVAAGGESRFLSSISRRWQRASEISLESPDEAIRRYDSLTRELESGDAGDER